jgi:UDP-3-O-[3-hydroxymyristoyl] glucosamine N-acyltransferase
MKSYTLLEINEVLNGEIIGTVTQKITAPEQLDLASNSEISFIGNRKYEKLWANSKACLAIVNQDISIEPGENRAFIKVKNADLAMSQVLAMFAPPAPIFHSEIHKTAVIDDSAIRNLYWSQSYNCRKCYNLSKCYYFGRMYNWKKHNYLVGNCN